LSFFAFCLGCYTFYTGRKAAKVKWEYLFLTLASALWSLGIAWVMEERSPAFTLMGITVAEIAISLMLPLVSLYLAAIDPRYRSLFHRILGFQTLAALALVFLIPLCNFRGTEFLNGKIELTLHKNQTFYLALIFSVLSPLVNFFMVGRIHKDAEYKRDRFQAFFWKLSFILAIFFLGIRFYFPVSYKYGCFAQFALVFLAYFHSQRYNTATLTLFNVASHVYSLVKTPLLVLNGEGKVILSNTSAMLFFGKKPGELTGADMNELFDYGDRELSFSKTAGTGNRIDKVEAVSRHNRARCEIEITHIYDGYQEFLYAIFIVYDMTDMKRLIGELEEETRRAGLANQAKSAFLANTSHEIRTPMNAIIGLSELILRENIPPAVYEYTLNIRQAGANLLSLINDVLDFSKIESGRLEIVPVRYYFRTVIDDVINIIRMRVIEKSLAFITDIDPALPNVLEGDEVRIRQILLNLLGNAVKYTERGFIRLAVSAERGTEYGGTDRFVLNIAVEDSGIGIKPEDLNKVFGEFVQVNTAASRGIEGSGLGLAITKGFCRAMGGDVTVTSAYGTGSVFTARIPQGEKPGGILAVVETPDKKPVLVYEDRPVYAESVCRSLEKLGVPHTLAGAAEAFQEALRRGLAPEGTESPGAYRFVLIAYKLYEGVRPVLEKGEQSPRVVILADYGAEPGIPAAGLLTLPVHVLSLADILNHREGIRNNLPKGKAAAAFTAPSARVLVVDDIATNLKVAQGLMAPYNMVIDTCLSGALAIELIRKNNYDLVFMDHMMPEMDGIEAVRLIRLIGDSESPYKTLPIIALTANALSGMKEMFLSRGFNDYLAKPIELSKLNGILERWVPREKQVKAGGSGPFLPSGTVSGDNSAGEKPGETIEEKGAGEKSPADRLRGIDFAAGLKEYQDEALYREALGSYRVFIPRLLNTLRDLSRDRLDVYAGAFHDFKRLSYKIYADQAGRQAEAMERAARAGDWETLQGQSGNVIAALETLFRDLGEFLDS
jgi:signal transduction histidine kinase/ActR/RegA family two-component response regulator